MEEALFVSGWTGSQELALLEALEECGYGNWVAIGNRLGRSQEECKRHYDECYITSTNPALPVLHDHICNTLPSNSVQEYDMAKMDYHGKEIDHYNPLRGDFDVEPDDGAEKILNDLPTAVSGDILEDIEVYDDDEEEEELDSCITSLQLAVVSSYRWRQRRRLYWKMIVREHGLIDIFRQQARERLQSTALRDARRRMRPFLRFLSSVNAEKLTQSFAWETELKDKWRTLLHYREMGITTLKGAELFRRLSTRREQMKARKKQMIKDLCRQEERLFRIILSNHQQQLATEVSQHTAVTETKQTGTSLLDISLSPGVDQLTQQEKEFCSQNRLLPEVFLRCKSVMVTEFKKNGKLRLMDARKMCRIDVNKTRKIYDLLKNNGLISNSS